MVPRSAAVLPLYFRICQQERHPALRGSFRAYNKSEGAGRDLVARIVEGSHGRIHASRLWTKILQICSVDGDTGSLVFDNLSFFLE